ncbi:MAG TPA: hypothetical protein VEH86_07370 [Candidatus Acidoferrum sp.]|nr:hypothetical protein [Candidatus Acidoferrum sp.]
MKTITIGIAFLVTMLLLSFPMILVRAQPETHNADAMWVEPPSTVFNTSNASVGTEFNVTVWLNLTETIFSYQVGLHYNRTQLQCIAAAFTSGITSSYFAGHTTVPAGPTIDTSSLGNGSVLAGESCLGVDSITGPKDASLFWAEFKILLVPSSGNFSSKFDITTEYPANTFVLDTNLNNIDFATYDGSYLFIGPTPVGPSPLSVSISTLSTLVFLSQPVLFNSSVTGGVQPYTVYQWYLNSTQYAGATSNSWTYTPNATGSDNVYLKVTDSNSTTAQSNTITITVSGHPKPFFYGTGVVNITDISLIAKRYGDIGPGFLYPGSPASPGWNSAYDLNGDNKIDMKDLVIICLDFGKTFS